MRKEVDKYELIECYLQGELSGKQLESFEQALQNDVEFANEVTQHKQLMSLVEDATFMNIRSKISEIHTKASTPTAKFQYKPWWGIAPAIIIAAGLLWFFTKPNASTIPSQESSPSVTIIDSNITADTNKQEMALEQVQEDLTIDSLNKVETNLNKVVLTEVEQPQVAEEEQSEISNENTLISKPVKQIAEIEALPKPIAKDEKDTVIKAPAAIQASTPITKDEEIPEPEDSKDENIIDCSEIEIYADVQLKPSCNNKPTGSIEIKESSVIGGEAPYSYSLDNVNFEPIEIVFENLRSKLYKVYIKDKNDCVSFLRTHNVGWINCEYHDVFAPTRGELWKIPMNDYDGTLKVISKNGSVVYELKLLGSTQHTWNGRTSTGDQLPMGNYVFIIEYDYQIEPMHGSITIVR